jgi:hypothetical protein
MGGMHNSCSGKGEETGVTGSGTHWHSGREEGWCYRKWDSLAFRERGGMMFQEQGTVHVLGRVKITSVAS